MARQLRAKGESVRLVALLDSGIKSGESQASGWRVFKSISTAIPSWLVGALQLNGSQWLDLVKLKRRQLEAKLAHTLGRRNGDARQPHNTKLINEMVDLFGFSEQHRKIAYAQHHAIRKYIPRVILGVSRFLGHRCSLYFPPIGTTKAGAGSPLEDWMLG